MVTDTVPRVAVAVAENETMTVHVGLHGLFEKVAVTPFGRTDVTVKVTGTDVPVLKVASIEEVGLVEPWATVKLLGEGVHRVKSKETGAVDVTWAVELPLTCVESPGYIPVMIWIATFFGV